MTGQRPGVRQTNKARALLERIDFDGTPIPVDVEAAKAYALIGLAEAVGALVLTLNRHPAAPPPETGA